MDNPASLMRRAKQKQRIYPVKSAPAYDAQSKLQTNGHTSSHANYSALMRSHDRMATRHIVPRGGA